jgi:putative ABC transport system substrate-binding protein
MRRRDLLALLGTAAALRPRSGTAQQPERMHHIGMLMAYAEKDRLQQTYVAAFREGLRKLGWTEGKNIRIDYRWAALDVAAMQRFAKELVGAHPDLIVSHNTPTTLALLQQTHAIPIGFVIVADPVGSGFAASLSRPDRTATGFATLEGSLGGKWVELLKEVAPQVARVAFLYSPATAPYAEYYLTPFNAAARSFAAERSACRFATSPNSNPLLRCRAVSRIPA